MHYHVFPVGDSAVALEFGKRILPEVAARIHAARTALEQAALPGVFDLVPTYCTLLLQYDPLTVRYETLCRQVEAVLEGVSSKDTEKNRCVVEIPVLYGGEEGPDLARVCAHTGFSEKEVIKRHTAPLYQIHMLGFLPGFAYLGGLDPALATPRLMTPRVKIHAGAVGIAGDQTGIYPMESPGGWQIIGRTPARLYDPNRDPVIPYEAGDWLKFVEIDREEYERLDALAKAGQWMPVRREVEA